MTSIMKIELDSDSCAICGAASDELMTPEEYDASAPPMQLPLRVMLLHLNNKKVLPEGRFCPNCSRRAVDAYEFSSALGTNAEPPLGDKIRSLRARLYELTQKINVFIVVGGAGASGSYSEDDIIMVDRDALAAATSADDEDLEKARNARGDAVYQCSVCPESFQRVSEYRAHMQLHPSDATHSCWTCGAQFASADAHSEHVRSHSERQLECHLCSARFASAAEARAHDASAECARDCPACGERATTRAALSAHASERHGRAADPPHVCPSCFAMEATAGAFATHMLRHRQAKQFVCGYDGCILRFSARHTLLAHIRKCHAEAEAEADAEPETPQSPTCETCGRTFASVAAMKRHSRVHRKPSVEYLELDELDDAEYRRLRGD